MPNQASCAARPQRAAAENWWIASYSALRIGDQSWLPTARRPSSCSMTKRSMPRYCARVPADSGDIHRFPRGPNPGTFPSWLAGMGGPRGLQQVSRNPQQIERPLASAATAVTGRAGSPPSAIGCNACWASAAAIAGLSKGSDARAVASVPDRNGVLVRQPQGRLNNSTDLVARHTHPDGRARRRSRPVLNGMFKGFIDLPFELDGRYYVPTTSPTGWAGRPGLRRHGHGTGRFSSTATTCSTCCTCWPCTASCARLPDYDYDRHVGGALFIFLRGAAAWPRRVSTPSHRAS